MSLPKIDLPLFELTVPSSGKKVKYRPFTVREEKILLIAQETEDLDQIILAIKQIINNCVVGIDVDNIPMFDLEYMIIHIRAKSVTNELEFNIVDNETKENIKLRVDLEQISLKTYERHTKKIKISDDYTLMMKYPSIDKLKELQDPDNSDAVFNMMVSCIDVLMSNDGDKIYKFSDFSREEIVEFIEGLNAKTISDIKLFFETVPVLRIDIPYKNKDGNDRKFVLEGLNSFFI
jgi:hypothetical protein